MCLGEQTRTPVSTETEKAGKQQSLFDDLTQDRTDTAAKEEEQERLTRIAISDLSLLHRIAIVQYKQLNERGLSFLAIQVEMPLIGILAEMEGLGFAIDQAVLEQLNIDMTKKSAEIEKTIYELAGTTFNINSSKTARGCLI